MTVLFLPPASVASPPEIPSQEDVSGWVEDHCEEIYWETGDSLHHENPNERIKEYARCALTTVHEKQFLASILEACQVEDAALHLMLENISTSRGFAECFVRVVEENRLGPHLAAIVEACEMLQDEGEFFPACGTQEDCDLCLPVSVMDLIDHACENKILCMDEIIRVEHLGTELTGECTGEMIIYDEFPELGDIAYARFTKFSGSLFFFFWRINTTMEPENNIDFEFLCEGEARIRASGEGGFFRAVVLLNETTGQGPGGTLCDYDGFIETECKGSFENLNEVYGEPGQYHADNKQGDHLPVTMIFEHKSGSKIENLGSGSFYSIALFNPDPISVPWEILDVPIEYEVIDHRIEMTEAPTPNPLFTVILAGIVGVARLGLLKR